LGLGNLDQIASQPSVDDIESFKKPGYLKIKTGRDMLSPEHFQKCVDYCIRRFHELICNYHEQLQTVQPLQTHEHEESENTNSNICLANVFVR
jgi:protein tyrosine phosphatase (PTP) superfamily phosphohydrolase (DUF442 family)